MSRNVPFYFCIVLVFLAGTCAAAAGDVSVQAVAEKDKVYLGEPLAFQIRVEGTDRSGKPRTEDIENFEVESLGGQARNRSSITIVNGRMEKVELRGYVWSYRLIPRKLGELTIPSIAVPVGSEVHRTRPVTVRVVEPELTEDFKLDVRFSKVRFYAGETVTVTVTWYLSRDVGEFQFRVPVLSNPDFIRHEPNRSRDPSKQYYQIPVEGEQVTAERGMEVLNGKRYATLSFQQILIAKEPGEVHVPESAVSCKAVVGYSDPRRRRSPFDGFFDNDFFSLGRQRVYETFVARSDPVELRVLPLPQEGRPDGFMGHVGRFEVEASAAPVDVRVGDPITWTVALGGSQWPERVKLPPVSADPEFARDFKIPEEMAAGIVKNGRKVFTQTLRARHENVDAIPAFKLPYFDPDAEAYRVARSEPIPIEVEPTKILTSADVEGEGVSMAARNELEAWSRGIAHNYEGPDVLVDRGFGLASILGSPGWLISFSAPLLLYAGLWTVARVRRKNADETVLRSRKALGRLKKRLKSLEDVSSEGDAAYAGLLEAVRDYLADKLGMNAAVLTLADVEARLAQKELDAAERHQLKEIFEACERRRYGGGLDSGPPVAELSSKALDIARRLDRVV